MRSVSSSIALPSGEEIGGTLTTPSALRGGVIFAHGTGSSRFSPRNRAVADRLNEAGFATLLMDLLTPQEEEAERYTRHLRFDVEMLAERLGHAIALMCDELNVPLGVFGASTGAAAALIAAAQEQDRVRAVVSRGGRPDLAGDALRVVRAPTLLIVGDLDMAVIELNEQARRQMTAKVEMRLVAGATHLFEEPGALDEVAELAIAWFEAHLAGAADTRSA